MAQYRIHRIKDTPRETFRWAAHTGGLAVVKPKDYEPDGVLEAATAYAAWRILQSEAQPLRPGDLLEIVTADDSPGPLQIAKYIGFEPAQWYAPEPKSEGVAPSVESIESAGVSSGLQLA
ncbi:MAG TPA: hypothetical protein VK493_15035 [Bryobacteraceae bacterium]|nr:hypothetical protein [Bryobacteraceae bacterium]